MAKTILLVDDDVQARGLMRTLLSNEGYAVVEAGDGIEAVRRFRQGGIDLVVTDIFMPGKSGLDAILEVDPKRHGVPVIALSGGQADGPDPLETARMFGAARTFSKPFDTRALLAAVGELLAGKA